MGPGLIALAMCCRKRWKTPVRLSTIMSRRQLFHPPHSYSPFLVFPREPSWSVAEHRSWSYRWSRWRWNGCGVKRRARPRPTNSGRSRTATRASSPTLRKSTRHAETNGARSATTFSSRPSQTSSKWRCAWSSSSRPSTKPPRRRPKSLVPSSRSLTSMTAVFRL